MTDFSFLEGKKILITGASGLIGRAIVTELLSHEWKKPAKVVALVRDENRARECFKALPQANLEYLVCDVCDLQPQDMGVDYVIHGANHTASRSFVEQPADVISGAVKGTENVLNFARANKVKGLVYLSSMEVYGSPETDGKIYENSPSYLDSTSVRSSYPESKRLCECLCAAYYSQYGVPAKVVRLTQTLGEGVAYNDNRLFAELARCVIEGRDVVLKTTGETRRSYLYVGDAVSAILTVLGSGKCCEAYNAANESTYCSVINLAQTVAATFGDGKVKVVIDTEGAESRGFAPTLKMNLATDKLRNLGWKAETDLMQAFSVMIDYMKKNKR